MPTKVVPGDVIVTTVKLSQDGDIRFRVIRNRVEVLANKPATFDYTDTYTVTAGDQTLVYAYAFSFLDDDGEYAIQQTVNGQAVNGDTRKGSAGHGPFLDFYVFFQ
jgi:hypothetical protein